MKFFGNSAYSPVLSDDWTVLNAVQRWGLALMVVSLGLILAYGFQPTAQSIFRSELFSFPIASALFCLSLPGPVSALPRSQRLPAADLIRISVLPLVISGVFGFFLSGRPNPPTLVWTLISVPVGEELLFRGWFYRLLSRLYPHRLFTATNPLPAALLGSSLAFSLWHLQNIGSAPVAFVLFQVGYTFFAGIWLGYVYAQSGRLTVAIGLHVALNLAGTLGASLHGFLVK